MNFRKYTLRFRSFVRAAPAFFLFAVMPLGISAQELASRHISTREGLSSSTVYKIFEDSKGFVWFATEYGLDRFDGKDFMHISTSEGLPGTPVVSFYEDRSEVLWLVTANGKICTWDGQKINSNPFGMVLDSYFVNCITEDDDGYFYIGTVHKGVLKFKGGALIKSYVLKEKYSAYSAIDLCFHNDEIFGASFAGLFRIKNDKLNEMPLTYGAGRPSARIRIKPHKEENYIIGSEHGLTEVKGDKQVKIAAAYIKPSQYGILDFVSLKDKHFWVATNKGILDFDSLNSPSPPRRYLTEKTISGICEDREGNIWIATLGSGVYFLPSRACQNYNIDNYLLSDEILCVTGDKNGRIYAGDNEGNVYVISGGRVEHFSAFKRGVYCRVTNIAPVSVNQQIISTDLSVVLKNDSSMYEQFNFRAGKQVLIDDGYIWFASTPVGLSKLKIADLRNKPLFDPKPLYPGMRGVESVSQYSNAVYFNTSNGIFKADSIAIPVFPNKLKGYSIKCFVFADNGELWVGTKGNGLIRIDISGKKKIYTEADGIAGNFCEKIRAQKNIIYLATNKGISRIAINDKGEQIINYDLSSGLPSNEINDIFIDDADNIWAASNKGLTVLNQRLFAQEKRVAPVLIVEQFFLNGREATTLPATLPHYINDIAFKWSGIYFKNPELSYRYRLSGVDENWQTTSEKQIHYSSLGSGSYSFEVFAFNDGGSSAIERVDFSIEKAWWQQTWWLILFSIGGFGVIVIIIYSQLSTFKKWQKKKEIEKRRVVESEIRALRGQMNPHFLFNALNSIQHYILQQDKMAANEYLAKFAKLMRMVLENSKKLTISLGDELKFLNLYLELERLRFENRLNYEIRLDGFDDTEEIYLPSMIIQPIVENAIKHGISHKSDGGTVSVLFKKERDMIVCTITDNGVGRERAKQIALINSTDNTGTGIAATIDRLNLLNSQKKVKASMSIKDLLSNEGLSAGTLIELEIPLSLS